MYVYIYLYMYTHVSYIFAICLPLPCVLCVSPLRLRSTVDSCLRILGDFSLAPLPSLYLCLYIESIGNRQSAIGNPQEGTIARAI